MCHDQSFSFAEQQGDNHAIQQPSTTGGNNIDLQEKTINIDLQEKTINIYSQEDTINIYSQEDTINIYSQEDTINT